MSARPAVVALLVSLSALASPFGAAGPARAAGSRPTHARVAGAAAAREERPRIPIVHPTGPQPSFARYQVLLNDYVHRDSPPDSALDTSFNYEKLYDTPKRTDREAAILEEFLAISPSSMDSLTRTAWAINFYNYLVIQTATDNLLIPGKTRQRWLSVRDIMVGRERFFSAPVVKIDSVRYSLDQFEKHFLFRDFDHAVGAKPPPGLDPRIHFALVCGAHGCPPLQPRAFRPESLDDQLDHAVRTALALDRHLTQDPQTRIFRLSSIFSWYVSDFGGRDKLLPWALRYAPPRWRAALKAAIPTAQFGLIPFDWMFNQTIGWLFEDRMRVPLSGPNRVLPDTT